MSTLRVLLIEDVAEDARMISGLLAGARGRCFVVTTRTSIEGCEPLLREKSWEVILLNLSCLLPEPSAGVARLQACAPHVPIILLSTVDDENLALTSVHHGAQDNLVKGQLDARLLARAIHYAVERKQAETALMRAEEKYRAIFENTIEGIFQTSPSGQFLSANSALARIYGYTSPRELMESLRDIGRDLYVQPQRRGEFVRLMEKNDIVTNFESRIYRKDGTVIWISENVRAVRDKDSNLQYYEGTVENITDRKRTEENLKNSEALYHSLVENLPQNIFRKNLSEQFTFANQRFCETIGKPLEDILGHTDFDFFPPALAAKYQKDDQVIMQTGKIFETIEEYQPPGGEKLYVNVVKSPLHDSQGKIIGLQGIFWDITERKRSEERVKQASLELARSREELSQKNEVMEEDLRMAREIQQAILPQQYPAFPRSASLDESALRFAHRYFPTGAVGGDFFNVSALSDTKAGVFICDVMGHGVRSALVTAILRALVEELTLIAHNPGQLLAQINRDLRAILQQTGTPMFTTAFYLVVDLEKHELAYANAGHPKPMLLHRGTRKVEYLKNSDGRSRPALGLMDKATYSVSTVPFEPGDLLLLFTDGVYDVQADANLPTPEWLAHEVEKRAEHPSSIILDELLRELLVISDSGEFLDDVCLVAVESVPSKRSAGKEPA